MKLFKFLFAIVLSVSFFFYWSSAAYATEDINISEIQYLNHSVFKVNVNTNNDSVDGVTLILNVTGDFNISEITEGTTGLCDSFEYQQTEKSISITCLEQNSKSIDGTVAEITATVGTSYSIKVSTEDSDFGGLEKGNITNIDINPSTVEDNDTNQNNNTLLYVSAGVFLLLLLVLIVLIQRKKNSIKKQVKF